MSKRNGPAPIEILSNLVKTDPSFRLLEQQVKVQPHEVKIVPLAKLIALPSGSDPNELIKNRLLSKGGAMLLAGVICPHQRCQVLC